MQRKLRHSRHIPIILRVPNCCEATEELVVTVWSFCLADMMQKEEDSVSIKKGAGIYYHIPVS